METILMFLFVPMAIFHMAVSFPICMSICKAIWVSIGMSICKTVGMTIFIALQKNKMYIYHILKGGLLRYNKTTRNIT